MTKEEAFKNWGTENGWSHEKSVLFNEALKIHQKDMEENPSAHIRLPQKYHWNCWHEYNCSCGFCHSLDTSD